MPRSKPAPSDEQKGPPESLILAPMKISKQGTRYYLEIPKSMVDVIQTFRDKPLVVTIKVIDYSKI